MKCLCACFVLNVCVYIFISYDFSHWCCLRQVVPLMGSQNLVKGGKPVLIAASALQMKDADHASAGAPVFLGLSNSTQAPVFAVNVAELSRYSSMNF